MRVLACVVAFNRAPLLKTVLERLVSQTADVDVLVVDNASTDSTAEVVAAFGDRVQYFNTRANLGGAGGFAWALELAMALDYDYAYLLDDDAIPDVTAIQVLLDGLETSDTLRSLPFLVSCPVADDTTKFPAGVPEPSTDFDRLAKALPAGAIAIDHAAFLGVLIDLHAARRTPLPYPEFFIWCDDVEYTTRLAGDLGGACLPSSRLVHESVEMESALAHRALGWKYFYKVRNTLWLARWGLPQAGRSARITMFTTVLSVTATELLRGPNKPQVLRTAARAWTSGLFTPRPKARRVGSLIAGSPDARTWLRATASRVS